MILPIIIVLTVISTMICVASFVMHFFKNISISEKTVIGKYTQWLQKQLELVFIDWSLNKCSNIIIISTIVFAGIGYLKLGIPGAIFGLAFGSFLPYAVAKILYKQYLKKMSDQLVDALRLSANSLKAGHSLIQAFTVIVEEMPLPIKHEFELVIKQNQLGATLEEALETLSVRVPLEDFKILSNSINILKQSGGNLVQTFETLVKTISERKRLEDKIKTVTAESKMQGFAGAAAPWFILIAMHFMQPDIVNKLFTEPIGWIFLGAAAVLDIIGLFIILKLSKIDI